MSPNVASYEPIWKEIPAPGKADKARHSSAEVYILYMRLTYRYHFYRERR